MPKIPDGIERIEVKVRPNGRLDRRYAARYVGRTPKTLAHWKMHGKGPPCIRYATGRCWYLIDDLDAFKDVDESRLLRLIAHGRLVRTFVGGGSQYSINGSVVPSRPAERLIKDRILLPADPGLLDGVPQSWRVRRPDDGQK